MKRSHDRVLNRLTNGAIGIFLLVPLFHLVTYVFTPWRPIFSASTAWAGIVVFYVGFLVAGVIGLKLLDRDTGYSASNNPIDDGCHRRMITTMLVVSTAGLVLHMYSKLPLLESVDMGCIGQLRSNYLSSNSEKFDTGLRLASATGHLLANFYAPGLFLGTAYLVAFGWSRRMIFAVAGLFLVAVTYAGMMVSRSVMLTLIGVMILGAVFGFALGKTRSGAIRRAVTVIGVSATILVVINAAIFLSKIECSNGDGLEYVESNARAMPVIRMEKGASGGCATCLSTLMYLNHGIYNFVQVTAAERRGEPVLFGFARYWGERLGMLQKSTRTKTRVYAAGGVTLPGAAFHDFGWSGPLLAGIGMALLLLLGAWMTERGGPWLWFGITGFAGVGIMMVESLIFVAPATLSFPFVMTAFLAVALVRFAQLELRKI